jgi:hypothetical protein
MNDIERQIFAATFAAAFHEKWSFLNTHRGVHEAMKGVAEGFQFAEVADLAVKSYRRSLTCDDREYLLVVAEDWK